MNAIKGNLSFDPYEVLELSKDSSDTQIVKAFRKAALKWHPDKNPDRKKLSEEMFLKISQAFELLSDPAAKAAYDRLVAARTAKAVYNEQRKQSCNAQRARLLEELERREARAASSQEETKLAQRRLEKEIQRLREEGSRLLQRERERLEKQIHENYKTYINKPSCSAENVEPARLKVKWKCVDTAKRLEEEDLLQLFGKYGKISMVVMSPSGKPNAIVEFEDEEDALKAENERGNSEFSIKVSWISARPTKQGRVIQGNAGESSPAFVIPERLISSAEEFAAFEAEVLAKMMATDNKKTEGSKSDHL